MTLGLQLHLQRVGVGDPAFECIVQRHFKAGLAQNAVVVVGPVQPGVLGRVAGNAKNAALCRHQPHVHQPGDGIQFGLGIAVQ